MRSSTYWRRFYRKFNWAKAYDNRIDRLSRLAALKAPSVIVASEARLILEAHYRGRWRAVWGVFKDACWSHYAERYSDDWEWVRTRIFRRAPDPDIAELERDMEEEDALAEMVETL